MRLSALALAVVLLAGCSSLLEARDAKALLERAQAEQAKLSSAAFEVRLDVVAEGEKYSFVLDGAAQVKGAHAGDQFVRARATGKGESAFSMWFAKRGRRVTTSFGGEAQSFQAGEPGAPDVASLPSFGSIDFASCVERLDVAEGRRLNEEPATRIAGVVDTECILRAAAKLLLDLAAEALSRRRVAVETPDYEEQSAFRHEAQKAGSSLASLEAALAPGRLDIC
jgi:hypothetical protein